MIYLFVIILLLFLSFRYDINGKTKGRDQWYLALLVIFILIAGLRWRLGVDTVNYLNYFYHNIPHLSDFNTDDYSLFNNPLWVLLNSLVLTLGGRFYIVQLLQATIVNTLYFVYFRRHCNYIFICVTIYFVYMYIGQNMGEMKSSISVVLFLFGNDCISEKKYVKGYLLYLVGCLFHFSAFALIIMPMFLFIRLNKFGAVLLLSMFFVGYLIQKTFGDYLELFEFDDALSSKAEHYAETDKYSSQRDDWKYFVARLFPYFFYPVLSILYLKKYARSKDVLKLEPYIMFGLVFVVLQMNVNLFYRYVHFFEAYFVLIIAHSFMEMSKKIKNVSVGVAYLRSMLIFFPFIFFVLFSYKDKYIRFYPYSSVIERSIDKERELYYSAVRNVPVRYDEY